MKLKRTFLLGLVVSVALAALMGIYTLIFGQRLGDLEVKVLLSTLTVGMFSLTSLVSALVHERGVWRPVMVTSWIVSGLGLVVYLLSIWVLFDWLSYPDSELLAKFMFILAIVCIALPHAGLLALTRFDRQPYRMIRLLSLLMIMLLAGTLIFLIVVDFHGSVEWLMRVIGIQAILVAAGTITTPVLQKLVGLDRKASVQTTKLELQIQCPRCLTNQTVATGHSRCGQCRLKFQIEIEEPRCPQCQYLLHRLTRPVCPECGCMLAPEELTSSGSAD